MKKPFKNNTKLPQQKGKARSLKDKEKKHYKNNTNTKLNKNPKAIRLRLLMIFIDSFKMMIFIEFDRFLKTSIYFCRVCKCMYDFHIFLF